MDLDHKIKKRKRYFLKLKKGLINDISKIDVKIHMIQLTGDYLLGELQNVFKKLAITKPDYSKRSNYYQTIAYLKRKRGTVTVLTLPTQGYIPQCRIDIPNPTQRLLLKLLKQCPALSVSKAEYTIDIVYPSPQHVRRYFYLLRRYIYIPHAREIYFYTHDNNLWKSKINMTLYAGPLKIYERGKDQDKVKYEDSKRGWIYETLDRVRLEVTAKREILSKHGLGDLSEFIRSLKFEDIFMKHLLFKRFSPSARRVKRQYEHYKTKDREGHGAAFYSEFKDAYRVYKNPAQYLRNVRQFEKFKKLLVSHIKEFEKKWSTKYSELEKDIYS